MKPYPIVQQRSIRSPFRTVEAVRKYLALYKSGHPIGFTRVSSLKSMGLIPRSDGRYVLGVKYR